MRATAQFRRSLSEVRAAQRPGSNRITGSSQTTQRRSRAVTDAGSSGARAASSAVDGGGAPSGGVGRLVGGQSVCQRHGRLGPGDR